MDTILNLPGKLASFLFSIGMLLAALNLPKGPPSSPSAQLTFPFMYERKVRYPTYPFGGWSKPNA